jgi:catechol-2,3-dioxygenase
MPRLLGISHIDLTVSGLDHLAFQITDADELQNWVSHLVELGVPHSGIIDTGYGPTLVFRDPTTSSSNSTSTVILPI